MNRFRLNNILQNFNNETLSGDWLNHENLSFQVVYLRLYPLIFSIFRVCSEGSEVSNRFLSSCGINGALGNN